jgi:hypothetical protein
VFDTLYVFHLRYYHMDRGQQRLGLVSDVLGTVLDANGLRSLYRRLPDRLAARALDVAVKIL